MFPLGSLIKICSAVGPLISVIDQYGTFSRSSSGFFSWMSATASATCGIVGSCPGPLRKYGSMTLRWRGQSAANSSRKWSSQSQVFWDADGKMDPFPQAVGLSKRLVLFIFCECAFGPRRLIFPPIKESASRLGPNSFKTSGFLANYGSKAHDIGDLDRNDHSGVLWPAYPIQLRALAARSASSSMQKRAPNPPARGASPNASV